MKTIIRYKGDKPTILWAEFTDIGYALSSPAWRLFMTLKTYVIKFGPENIFPSQVKLGEQLGLGVSGVREYSKELEEVGLVVIHKKQRIEKVGVCNVYELQDERLWSKNPELSSLISVRKDIARKKTARARSHR